MITRRNLLAAGSALALSPTALFSAASESSANTDPRFDAVGSAVANAVASRDIPGAVSLVWQGGKLRCVHQDGVRDIQSGAPVDMHTIMPIASMSKPVTVATAMRLIDRRQMKLDDPITRWAPEFANMRVLRNPAGPIDDTYAAPRAITIENLMTHRAGMIYGFNSQGPLAEAMIARVGMGIESTLTADAWMRELASLPLAHEPGSRFSYGHSIDVLGFIIGRVTGRGLRRTMREELFAPLGMEDTDFWIPPARRGRAGRSYFSPAVGQFTPVDIAGFVAASPADYTSGGQGLVSTAADYLKFARMLLDGGKVKGKQLLKAQSVQQMATDHLTAEQRRIPAFWDPQYWQRWGQGLGMTVLRDPKLAATSAGEGSFGWGGAFGGWWQADPTRDAILIWMQQCLPAPPLPGSPPSTRGIPGAKGVQEFQTRAYSALG
jgi:CubicO group peptidase (beta-lactamase class C family)